MTPPTDPRQLPPVFAAAFNSGDPAAVAACYAPGAVFVPAPGAPAVTGSALAAANAEFMGVGLPIAISVRHCHRAGDLALLIADWSIEGAGPDGSPLRIGGTATDVARRGPDGLWRYAIDNPFGTAPESDGDIRPNRARARFSR
ncbi:YybH family protein [Streptomyces sp. BI20]|uniref:YybH family protein n=1 Tax=Streptomyces sp. BI20 TaxID=3403460 RepID=UPI003C74D13E